MYTVLRFCALSDTDVQSLGETMEELLPGVFTGTDKGCSDRVSVPLAEDDEWSLHIDSIRTKMALLDELVVRMRSASRTIELDVAIEPGDYNSLLSEFVFDNAFLDLLVSRRITLIMSVYGLP